PGDAAGNSYSHNVANTSITVYAPGAGGTATPTATIAGGSTGLSRPAGIALDGAGNIYVSNFNNNSITVYAPGASGNATPTTTIAGGNTGLGGPVWITLECARPLRAASAPALTGTVDGGSVRRDVGTWR